MVEDFTKIVEELKKKYPSLTLFAAVKMDELVDTWSIIFAADEVRDSNTPEIYDYISKLIDTYAPKVAPRISRVGIFESKYYLVKEFLSLNQNEFEDVRVNGNIIHYGVVFYPERPVAKNENAAVSSTRL